MLKAIIYQSNSGYTAEYARLLSEKTSLPCLTLNDAKDYRGKDVIFLGWLMAGNIQGLKSALKKFRVRAIGAVGMATYDANYEQELAANNTDGSIPLFYMQGGFDMNRLKGVYKFMMKLAVKSVNSRIEEAATKGEQPDENTRAMQQMVRDGGNFVCDENLSALLEWFEEHK